MSGSENQSPDSRSPSITSEPSEPSGTLNHYHHGTVPDLQEDPSAETASRHSEVQKVDGEEQPLEWHEVIELQAFSDRNVWIREKIMLLEQLPPIEVFVGLDAVRNSALQVPGLPTRAELQEWIAEHDRIEKETEVFDSGELKKLKKFTKAAAQRNLSPADTDLIEITLTTIYALDKLLHLLRDRSEHLDLLSVRLRWEEHRIAAWNELHNTIGDITNFLRTRARWSPNVYDDLEVLSKEDDLTTLSSSHRRNSVVSIASIASDTSNGSLNYSRGARFKLSEQLSRDAAQFASRVSSLRHSKINAAGKAMDKLIDDSRKPVPEVLLDEQDKLEDKGIKEMEDVGKFVMSVVMQWKKADEMYVETMKDKGTALELIEEIETAKLSHPNSRQDAAYLSRTNALTKRLAIRGNPAASSSTFPRPFHDLFPDQSNTTEYIVQLLSSEYVTAVEHAKKAEALSRHYHGSLDAVKKVETLCKAAAELVGRLLTCISHFQDGVGDENGDGTPPNLSTQACLVPSRHTVFLALLPSLSQESEYTEAAVGSLLDASTVAFADLDRPGIDLQFIAESKAEITRLRSVYQELLQLKKTVLTRVTTLHNIRRLWTNMETAFKDINQIRYDMLQSMQRDMWNQRSGLHNAPPTPEGSPASVPIALTSNTDYTGRIDAVAFRLEEDSVVLSNFQTGDLGPVLHGHVAQCRGGLLSLLASSRNLFDILEAIRRQTTVMRSIESEVNDLHTHLEDLEMKFDDCIRDVLEGAFVGELVFSTKQDLHTNMEELKSRIQALSDSLITRIPFISDGRGSISPMRTSLARLTPLAFNLTVVMDEVSALLPVDLTDVDRGVRMDANAFSVGLSGSLESLALKAEAFRLSQVSRALDVAVAALTSSLQQIDATLTSITGVVDSGDSSPTSLHHLDELLSRTTELSGAQLLPLLISFDSIHDLLRVLSAGSSTLQPSLLDSRRHAVHSVEQKYATCEANLLLVVKRITDARSAEEARLRELRRLEEEVHRMVKEEQHRPEEAGTGQGSDLAKREKDARIAEQPELETMALAGSEERGEKEAAAAARYQQEGGHRLKVEPALIPIAERKRQDHTARPNAIAAFLVDGQRAPASCEHIDLGHIPERQSSDLHLERRLPSPTEADLAQVVLMVTGTSLAMVEEELIEMPDQEQGIDQTAACDLPVDENEATHGHLDSYVHCPTSGTGDATQSIARDGSGSVLVQVESLGTVSVSLSRSTESLEMSTVDVLQPAWEPTSTKDIFSVRSGTGASPDDSAEFRTTIFQLRKRLRSIGINDLARPSARGLHSLPVEAQYLHVEKQLMHLVQEAKDLHVPSINDEPLDAELRSLRSEIEASQEMLQRVYLLTELSKRIVTCDSALSDLLEHIDSYPSLPLGALTASHTSDPSQAADQQLIARLIFTEELITTLKAQFSPIADDARARSEHERIVQTWSELQAMGMDRTLSGESRPARVLGSQPSGGSRPASVASVPKTHRKAAGYANLSVGSPSQFLSPPLPHTRRAASGGAPQHSRGSAVHTRSSSRASLTSNRSVSGPGPVDTPSRDTPSRLHKSTFASRQRTSSISSTTSAATQVKFDRAMPSTSRVRAQTTQSHVSRTSSPAFSDASSMYSRSSMNQSRASVRSTWARASRQSFSSLPRSPPRARPVVIRKPYIANPTNRLDVAVGDVVNKLPSNVDINVEVVADTWKDQSGKYWIGNQDAKLCFCRILRSHTVMVRVGGGWSELSKFIKDHFADAFRLMPESPPRFGSREEKWINSSSLSQAAAQVPDPPRTPEPKNPYIPSFALSSPSGASPRSIKTSSPGSPLTALQFIRRADRESPLLIPETPTKSTNRSGLAAPIAAPRVPAWRP